MAIPIFLVCSRTVEATGISGRKLSVLSHLKNLLGLLPAEVSEGTVGLSHFVSFLAFFNDRTCIVVCVNQFHRQSLRHGRTFGDEAALTTQRNAKLC